MLLFPDKNLKITLPYDKKQHLITCFSRNTHKLPKIIC